MQWFESQLNMSTKTIKPQLASWTRWVSMFILTTLLGLVFLSEGYDLQGCEKSELGEKEKTELKEKEGRNTEAYSVYDGGNAIGFTCNDHITLFLLNEQGILAFNASNTLTVDRNILYCSLKLHC